jgi:Tfp pilus assembly protein PilF
MPSNWQSRKIRRETNAAGLLASQYIQTKRFDDGLKQLDELLKRNPSNAGAMAVKGMIFETQGKVEEAKQIYTQALGADPNNEVAANNLAFILAEQGKDLNTALSWAQMARRKQPENPNAADTLGWVYYKQEIPCLPGNSFCLQLESNRTPGSFNTTLE